MNRACECVLEFNTFWEVPAAVRPMLTEDKSPFMSAHPPPFVEGCSESIGRVAAFPRADAERPLWAYRHSAYALPVLVNTDKVDPLRWLAPSDNLWLQGQLPEHDLYVDSPYRALFPIDGHGGAAASSASDSALASMSSISFSTHEGDSGHLTVAQQSLRPIIAKNCRTEQKGKKLRQIIPGLAQ